MIKSGGKRSWKSGERGQDRRSGSAHFGSQAGLSLIHPEHHQSLLGTWPWGRNQPEFLRIICSTQRKVSSWPLNAPFYLSHRWWWTFRIDPPPSCVPRVNHILPGCVIPGVRWPEIWDQPPQNNWYAWDKFMNPLSLCFLVCKMRVIPAYTRLLWNPNVTMEGNTLCKQQKATQMQGMIRWAPSVLLVDSLGS